ncbi:leucine-rich repeat domain-containing protein [Culturomica massiliensis]|uniref:leucine-rich repeat domain-containing protein n=1 Tax=Culturomica massiliensis TaxID=1841857 RepID=UPI00266F8DC2|nr:hypothetical protein [Culturomica massiliensis]
MKRIFILLMVAMCATMFTACSDDDNKGQIIENEGIITMVTEKNEFSFWMVTSQSSTVTIDWGDNTVQVCVVEYDKYNRYFAKLEHTYSDKVQHTIKISGCTELKELSCKENQLTALNIKCTTLEFLECYNNQLTSLDVSTCIALEYLSCQKNQLTSLDLTGCVTLLELFCSGNQFSENTMNKIYNALPDRNKKDGGYIEVSVPYGETTIAENKNWSVYKSTTN